jgi:hypothetical protein
MDVLKDFERHSLAQRPFGGLSGAVSSVVPLLRELTCMVASESPQL